MPLKTLIESWSVPLIFPEVVVAIGVVVTVSAAQRLVRRAMPAAASPAPCSTVRRSIFFITFSLPPSCQTNFREEMIPGGEAVWHVGLETARDGGYLEGGGIFKFG